MRTGKFLRNMIGRAGVPALAILFMGFFGYNAVLGSNGILRYPEYNRQLELKQAEFQKLDQQRAELKNRVRLLDPKHADPDMVDELVRKELNVQHPDEFVIYLNQK